MIYYVTNRHWTLLCMFFFADFPIPNSGRPTKPVFQCGHKWWRQSNGNSGRCWRECYCHPTGHCPNEWLCAYHQSCFGCTIWHCYRQTQPGSNAQVCLLVYFHIQISNKQICANACVVNDVALHSALSIRIRIIGFMQCIKAMWIYSCCS